MGAINWYQMYDIDISKIWHEALIAEVPDKCFKELYSQFDSLMSERDEKYTQYMEIEKYSASNHFHFVDLYELWANRSQEKRTGFQNVKSGYTVASTRALKYDIWKEEIVKVLEAELPKQLKGNTIENTTTLANKVLFPDTSQEEREKFIKFQMGRHTVEERRIFDDDVREAYRWTYDIYWFRHSKIILTYNTDDIDEKKYFTYFFAWAVAVVDIEQLDGFLKFHLINNFDTDWNGFGRFLELLLMKHEGALLSKNQVKLVNKWLESKNYIIVIPEKKVDSPIEIDLNENLKMMDNLKKSGRKPVDKISLPIRELRKPRDKRTIFGKDDTAKLFTLLAQLGCIFNEKEGIAKSSVAGAIQVLTGFSADKMEEFLNYDLSPPKNEKDKMKLIEDIKNLIINAL